MITTNRHHIRTTLTKRNILLNNIRIKEIQIFHLQNFKKQLVNIFMRICVTCKGVSEIYNLLFVMLGFLPLLK